MMNICYYGKGILKKIPLGYHHLVYPKKLKGIAIASCILIV